MALVSYHALNVLTVGLPEGSPMVLIPGINEVEEKDLELALKNPIFRQRIKDGKVKLIEVAKTDSKGRQEEQDMLDQIPQIFDSKLLKKIIKSDGRDSVVEAAKAQLDKISSPKAFENKEESSEHFR